MKRLIFAEPALQDFEEIHDYIAQDNADAALRFIGRLKERCDELVMFPGIGRQRDEIRTGYRSITEADYLILYRLPVQNTVEIVRVIHTKRHLGKALTE